MLRNENDKLRAENMSIRDAMRNPVCVHCGGPAIIGDASLEEQHLRIENARLRDELERVCGLTSKFLGQPVSSMGNNSMILANSNLELGVGSNNCHGGLSASMHFGQDFGGDLFTSSAMGIVNRSTVNNNNNATGIDKTLERSMLLDVALAAMDELIKLAQSNGSLWIKSAESATEILNGDEYMRTFTPCVGMKPSGFVTEASRETGVLIVNSMALVETLMDSVSYTLINEPMIWFLDVILNSFGNICVIMVIKCDHYLGRIDGRRCFRVSLQELPLLT